tara:strand:+ start:489 stop:737 length:249 start_codon:yes stop_codon:yes gene_type:complete
MCLGGSAAPTYRPPPPRVIPPGPESPQDKVNNQEVENINDRSQQDARRNANRGATATAQSNKGYGGTIDPNRKYTSAAPGKG